MDDCIFCKIIRKQIPADFVLDSDLLVAFKDISPAAKVHILIVPKEHISQFGDLAKGHGQLLVAVYQAAKKLVAENHLENDLYRVVVNGGKAQKVPHLHFHFVGGQWKKRI